MLKKYSLEGYDVTKYLVELQGKIAFPMVILIMVFIAVPFSLRSERSGGVMQSIGIGIFIGFSYWIVHAFSMSLGRSEILPVFLAAWGANILFAAVPQFFSIEFALKFNIQFTVIEYCIISVVVRLKRTFHGNPQIICLFLCKFGQSSHPIFPDADAQLLHQVFWEE